MGLTVAQARDNEAHHGVEYTAPVEVPTRWRDASAATHYANPETKVAVLAFGYLTVWPLVVTSESFLIYVRHAWSDTLRCPFRGCARVRVALDQNINRGISWVQQIQTSKQQPIR